LEGLVLSTLSYLPESNILQELAPCPLTTGLVAGFHWARPSTTLDKRFA